MSDELEQAAAEAGKAIKKIRSSGGKIQGNFYFAGDNGGRQAGIVVTLLARDRKGQKALAAGKQLRKNIAGAKFARGVLEVDNGKLMFTLHSGSASSGLMKRSFKDTLPSLDASLKVLKKALIRKDGGAAEVVDADAEEEVDAPLSQEEQEELATLIRDQEKLAAEQGGLAALNAQLSSFLSEEDASAEQAEQIADQVKKIEQLQASGADPAELRQARLELAEVSQIGDSPFPTVGNPISPQMEQLLALSMELMVSRVTEEQAGTNPGKYQALYDQVQAQLDILAALYGPKDGRCHTIHSHLMRAQQAVLTAPVPPDYNAGVLVLREVVAEAVRIATTGRREYTAQREVEASLESRRLEALRRVLQAESELRLIQADIDKLKKLDVDMIAITSPLKDAQDHHRDAVAALKHASLTVLSAQLPLKTGEGILRAAAQQQETVDAVIARARQQLAEARAAFNTAAEAAASDSDIKPLMADQDALRARLTAESRLTDEVLQGLLDRLQKLVYGNLLRTTAATDPDRTTRLGLARDYLADTTRRYDEAIHAYEEGYGSAAAAARGAEASLAVLMDVDLPENSAPLRKRLEEIRDQIEAREYEAAIAASTALAKEADAIVQRLIPYHAAWTAFKLADLVGQIERQKATDASFPHPPKDLGAEVELLQVAARQRSISYKDALAQGLAIQAKADENANRLGSLDELRAELDEATLATRAAIAALRSAAGPREDRDTVLDALIAPHEQRLDVLLRKSEAASTGGDLEGLRQGVSELLALKLAVEKASTGEPLDDALSAAELGAERARGERLRTRARELADWLQENGGEALLSLPAGTVRELVGAVNTKLDAAIAQEDIRTVESQIDAVRDGEVDQLDGMKDETEAEKVTLTQAVAAALEKANTALATFKAAVNEHQSGLLGVLRETFKVNLKEEYANYITTLETELAQLTVMSSAAYPGLMLECRDELIRFKADAEAALRGLLDLKQDGTKGKDSLSVIKHAVDDQVKRLDVSAVNTHAPTAKKDLTDRLQALQAKLGTELLSESQREFDRMVVEVTELLATSARAAEDLVAFNKKASGISVKLSSASQPITGFEMLVADLSKQLTAARDLSKLEGKLGNAMQMLETIEDTIERAHEGPELAKMVRDHDASASATEQARVEWEEALAAFNRELYDPYELFVKGDMSLWERFKNLLSDSKQIAEVKELRKLAGEAAGKGDYQMGRYQLSLARSRMEFYMKYPDGQDAAVIADLTRIPRMWRGAVQAFTASVDELARAIHAELSAREGGADAAQGVLDAAAPIKTLLRSDALDAAVAALTKDGLSPADKRAAREAALVAVHEQQQRLTDPRLVLLAQHPFSVGAFRGHFDAGKVLTDAEKTFLLSTLSEG